MVFKGLRNNPSSTDNPATKQLIWKRGVCIFDTLFFHVTLGELLHQLPDLVNQSVHPVSVLVATREVRKLSRLHLSEVIVFQVQCGVHNDDATSREFISINICT